MIRKILFISIFAAAFAQYQERAPPSRRAPPPEYYEEAPPAQPAFRPRPQQNVIHRPASVHYVNIGEELAGDYKFGYDTGKGNDGQSFREETRLPDGTVQGAYGYIDETGRQRIVKYTAGKDGFKAEGDVGPEGAPKAARARQPAPAPVQAAPAPQPQYQPPPQQAYRPPPPAQPAYRAPPPQPAYRAPPAQPAYRAPPAQPAYRPPPPAQPVQRAPPPQTSYAPEPQSYAPRPRPRASRPQYAPEPKSYDEPDYDDPNNDISERRIVPIDTTLFNYNIGTSQGQRN